MTQMERFRPLPHTTGWTTCFGSVMVVSRETQASSTIGKRAARTCLERRCVDDFLLVPESHGNSIPDADGRRGLSYSHSTERAPRKAESRAITHNYHLLTTAHSATTVLPADVCAATRTDSRRSCETSDGEWAHGYNPANSNHAYKQCKAKRGDAVGLQ